MPLERGRILAGLKARQPSKCLPRIEHLSWGVTEGEVYPPEICQAEQKRRMREEKSMDLRKKGVPDDVSEPQRRGPLPVLLGMLQK